MKKILFSLLPILVIFAGCEGLEDESVSKEEIESAFEYEFNENVKYYEEDLTRFVSLVNDTTMFILSAMPAEHVPKTGDVILCTSTANTPHGFLRRVVSIDSGTAGMTVNTESATITDAFKTLRFEQNFDYANYVKEFRDSLGNKIPFEIVTDVDSTQTKVAGEAESGHKVIKLDIGNRFFKGHAYIKSDIYVKFDVRFGKIDVTYVIMKEIGLKGKATISSSEMFGKDYEDDFSIPILDKSVPFGTPIGPPLMQFFPSLNFGISFAGNGNLSLEGEVNYILENTESRYSYKNGVEETSVKNLLEENSSWMKMVNLEATGEFGMQGSVGMELRLWNGDLLAFGGEAALWYGLKAEGKISMGDKFLLKESHELSIHPSLSATLYIESLFINNRKHRIEAKVEKPFERFNVSLLPEFEFEEKTAGSKLIVSPTIEPICMMEVSEVGFAVVHEKAPETPITHKTLPAKTIIEEVPTTEYVDVKVSPETIELPKPSSDDVGYYAVPYVVVDNKYYYGENLWVDLGLPSGILWARHNVGATSAEEYGGYYAWGETEEKEIYVIDTYKHLQFYGYDPMTGEPVYEYAYLGNNISGTEYDAANMSWKDEARLPTKNEILELINYCECHGANYSGVNGNILIGPNGNEIFIPLAGHKTDDELDNSSPQHGAYWTGSYDTENHIYTLDMESGHIYMLFDNWSPKFGLTIRPVKDKEE